MFTYPQQKSFSGKKVFGFHITTFLSMFDPSKAPEIAAQIQETIGHRTVSWQEREQVWLDVFKALRVSSAITVSSILLLWLRAFSMSLLSW